MRRQLTEEYVDSLTPPASGEVWIPDTEVRGFGIRLWSSGKSGGAAFAIRTTDKNGRIVRKTFHSYFVGYGSWYIKENLGKLKLDEQGRINLSVFLNDARNWARTEIDRLKGRLPSLEEETKTRHEYDQMRKAVGERIKSLSLGYLVDIILDKGQCRGWSEEYIDRLRHAFNTLDNNDRIRNEKIGNLNSPKIVKYIEESEISPGNLRLVRSLFNTLSSNVHALYGHPIGLMFPDRREEILLKQDFETHFLENAPDKEYDRFFTAVKNIQLDWRPKICIELCFLMRVPVSRIMRARWSQIVDGIWFPYSPDERKTWHMNFQTFNGKRFECLKKVHENALQENVSSEFWFPSVRDPVSPIANIDRAWHTLLAELGWPKMSLARCASRFQERFIARSLPDFFTKLSRVRDERREIKREIIAWNRGAQSMDTLSA